MSGNRVTKELSEVDKVAISGMRCVDTEMMGGKG